MPDAWPIDKLFLQMFRRNKIEHPLYHMAWTDVCTHDTPQNQQVFLSGGSVPYANPKQIADHLQRLTWRYLYPPPSVIQALVTTLVKMLFLFGTPQGEVAKVPLFRDRWEEIRGKVDEFGSGLGGFLERVYDSLPWDEVLDAPRSHKPARFQGLEDLKDRLNPQALGMSNDGDYDRAAAEGFLGSPELGWSDSSCVAILMKPLRTLFNWAAEQDKYSLGGDHETSLGQMNRMLAGFRMGNAENDRIFLAAHFVHRRENVPVRHFLVGEQQVGKDLNYSDFHLRHSECKPSTTQSPVRVEFKRLFALSGFNYEKYLHPFIRQLGAKYADSHKDGLPGDSWLWHALENAPNPLNGGVFDVRPEDTISRRVMAEITRRLYALKAPPPAQHVKATRRTTEGPPETSTRLRPGEEAPPDRLVPMEVASGPEPDKKSDGNGVAILCGAAALGALFVFAR